MNIHSKGRIAGMLKLLCFAFISAMAFSVHADVTIANVFGHGGMIQCGQKAPFWGSAAPGEPVKVTVSGSDDKKLYQTHETVTGEDGEWMVELSPLEAGKRYHITAKGLKTSVTLGYVIAGDVWLYIGRFLFRWNDHHIPPVKEAQLNEMVKDHAGMIRVYRSAYPAEKEARSVFADDTCGSWRQPYGWTIAGFSPGIATNFALQLRNAKNIPVGIVAVNSFSSSVEQCLPAEDVVNDPVLKETEYGRKLKIRVGGTEECGKMNEKQIAYVEKYLAETKAADAAGRIAALPFAFPKIPKEYETEASGLYSGAIHPLTPMAVKGVILYVGRSGNIKSEKEFSAALKLLADNLRRKFRNPELPLFVMQIAAVSPQTQASSENLEALQSFVDNDKYADLVVLNDFGKGKSATPAQKPEIAGRLLALALKRVYGDTSQVTEYPRLKGSKIEGNKVILTFSMRLKTSDGLPPDGFIIRKKGREPFVLADGEIKGNELILSAEGVAEPVSASYCMDGKFVRNAPNVIGENGMPLAPFRADIQNDKRTDAK